jgi:hypothetical protein
MKAALFLLPGLLLAQTDWVVPPEFRSAGYSREKGDKGFALFGPGPSGAMTQTVDALPYRGSLVRLRAAVRVEGSGTGQLLLRVDRDLGRLGFFDNMADRPVRDGEWKVYELTGEVAPDARTVEVGVTSTGKASVWVDEISFEKLPLPPDAAGLRAAMERDYARIDGAYSKGEVETIASFAAPDAAVLIFGDSTPLKTLLTQLKEQWKKGVKFQSRSTVTSVLVSGDEATVSVNNETVMSSNGVISSNRDTWVRVNSNWKLKESSLLATRPLIPANAQAEIRKRTGIPELKDVRIILFEGTEVPQIPGFKLVAGVGDRRASEERVVAYLKEHAAEAAGPAALSLQTDDVGRLASVVRAFDTHRAQTPEWLWARQSAVFIYQSVALGEKPEEVAGAQAIWIASQAYPNDKILFPIRDAVKVAPIVRSRYGKQVYVVGAVPRELLGGDAFVDLATVPGDSALGKWIAAQKFPYDAIVGQ